MSNTRPVACRTWDGGAVQDRLRTLNLVTTVPSIAVVGVALLVFTAHSWGHGLIQTVGLAAAVATAERWTAGDSLRVARPCLAVTAATWLAGALSDSSAASFGLNQRFYDLIGELGRSREREAAGHPARTHAVRRGTRVFLPEIR